MRSFDSNGCNARREVKEKDEVFRDLHVTIP